MFGEASESVDLRSLLPSFGTQQQQEEQPEGWLPALTWKERLIGCGICVVFGYMLSFGSFFRMKSLLTGNPLPFVLNATIGNIIALIGSCFLSGPTTQMKRMFKESRRIATIAYLVSLILTLVVAFAPIPGPKGLMLLLLMIVQYVSVFWYCLSYIPYARDALKRYCCRMISENTDI